MPPRRRTDPDAGSAALRAWAADPGGVPRPTLAAAVRWSLEELAERAPGHATEVRVPPFGAVQCVEGTRHTRGTPPNVVETDPTTWLALVTGDLAWNEAVGSGRVRASGSRADLSALLPVSVAVMSEGRAEAEPAQEQTVPAGAVQVRIRRAPRYRAFVLAGAVLGVVAGAVAAAVLGGGDAGFSPTTVTGYVGAIGLLVGSLLGAGVAVLVERR